MNVRPSPRFAARIVLALGAGALAFAVVPSRALTDRHEVGFPDDFARGVLYATIDRADLKQHRELYAPAAAIAAIKQGKPLPVGTVLTMVAYTPKLDPDGKPIADTEGRFTKDKLIGFLVMEKRPGGAAQTSSDPKSGQWRFQIFKADKRVDQSAKLTDCAECHQKRRDHDFVFTGDRMKSFSFEGRAH